MSDHMVDLVIPVYNEAHVLEQSLQRLSAAMNETAAFSWRIVVVDNGSTDGTDAVGRRAQENRQIQFLRLEQKGRGHALMRTWTETDASFSLYMDVDLSTELEAVPKAVALLLEGADLVTGSRLDPQSNIVRSRKREILSRGYNHLLRGVLRTRAFDDAQCGFKGVRLETIRPLLRLIRNRNWFFDTELLVLAEYASLQIRTLPIRWVEDPDTRVNIPRTVLEDLRGLARLWWTARPLIRDWQSRQRGLAASAPPKTAPTLTEFGP
jgi:glycosyltransferase involved in cell wall biosynthesis